MGLTIQREPQVTPPSIPESGGTVTTTFGLRAIEKATRANVVYSIDAAQPYVFAAPTSSGDPKVVQSGPHQIRLVVTDVTRTLAVVKQPASAPRDELLFIEIEVTEVDASGERTTLPSGRLRSPQHLTAVVTIE